MAVGFGSSCPPPTGPHVAFCAPVGFLKGRVLPNSRSPRRLPSRTSPAPSLPLQLTAGLDPRRPALSSAEPDVHLSRAFVLAAALLGTVPAAAGAQDVPWKPFNEITRGSEAGTGLFTIYSKRDRVYLALTPAHLDRDFLLVTQISQGIGELGLDGGSSLRSDLVRFH